MVNYIDKNEILRDIEKALTKSPDVIIACMHWGTEYKSVPDSTQIELASWLFAHGRDVIPVGSYSIIFKNWLQIYADLYKFSVPLGTINLQVFLFIPLKIYMPCSRNLYKSSGVGQSVFISDKLHPSNKVFPTELRSAGSVTLVILGL